MDSYNFSFQNPQTPNGHSCSNPNPSLFLSPSLQPNPGSLPVAPPLHIKNLPLSDLLKSSYGENFKFCEEASGEYQVLESYFSLKILHRFSPHIISETQSNSVSPSDSVSQVGSGSISNLPVQCAFSQPSIRPPHYSHKILWMLEDCQKDLHNIVTKSNKSRLAMEKAV